MSFYDFISILPFKMLTNSPNEAILVSEQTSGNVATVDVEFSPDRTTSK